MMVQCLVFGCKGTKNQTRGNQIQAKQSTRSLFAVDMHSPISGCLQQMNFLCFVSVGCCVVVFFFLLNQRQRLHHQFFAMYLYIGVYNLSCQRREDCHLEPFSLHCQYSTIEAGKSSCLGCHMPCMCIFLYLQQKLAWYTHVGGGILRRSKYLPL